jgi:3-oxoacyl-[acyl-carrier-protein] synthase III
MSASQASWIGIEAGAYFLPGEDACVSLWVESMNLPPETHERILQGGHRRYYPGAGQSVAELCQVAIRRIFDESALQAGDVDMLIHAHTMVTSVEAPPKSMVAGLARDLGMHRAEAFSISNLHCASMMGAMRIAGNMMAVDETVNNVVIVTADIIRGPELSHRNQTYVHSDGAAAIWVKRDCRRNRIGAIEIDNAGGNFHMGYMITEEQRRQYDMVSQLSTLRVIKRAIKRSGLTPENISKLVPQNVSGPGWRDVGKRFNESDDFVFDRNIAEKGHACCSDIIINLVDGGFLDQRGDDAIVATVRGTTGVYAAFVLQAA